MITPLRRKSTASGPSEQRAALAERVEAQRQAESRRAGLIAANETADATVGEARRAVEVAAEGVESARRLATEHLISVASGQSPEPPVSVRSAKALHDDAQDGLAAALAARDALATALDKAGGAFGLVDCALAVVKVEAREQAEALTGEVESLARDLARKAAELREIGPIVYGRNQFGVIDNTRASAALNRLSAPSFWSGLEAEQAGGRARWATAIEALMRDADAPLPS